MPVPSQQCGSRDRSCFVSTLSARQFVQQVHQRMLTSTMMTTCHQLCPQQQCWWQTRGSRPRRASLRARKQRRRSSSTAAAMGRARCMARMTLSMCLRQPLQSRGGKCRPSSPRRSGAILTSAPPRSDHSGRIVMSLVSCCTVHWVLMSLGIRGELESADACSWKVQKGYSRLQRQTGR